MKNPPLLVIVGETASGKSELALQLAQQLTGEILCADSWTARRDVNIGTAKPTAAEQAKVPHHLLDVVAPDEDFTAAVFKRLALQTIDEVAGRGHLPLLVGGTGLYIDGVMYDFGFLPAGDRAERETFNRLNNAELLAEIEARGLELGDVDIRNKRRLIRLLETNGARPQRTELRPNTLIIGLKIDRTTLEVRVEQRVDAMLAAGLEQEVQQLVKRYGWGCEALKGVGYAQWRDYFLGTADLEQTRKRIIKATLDLAKRQRTWFKRNIDIHWLVAPVNLPELVDFITTRLNIDVGA